MKKLDSNRFSKKKDDKKNSYLQKINNFKKDYRKMKLNQRESTQKEEHGFRKNLNVIIISARTDILQESPQIFTSKNDILHSLSSFDHAITYSQFYVIFGIPEEKPNLSSIHKFIIEMGNDGGDIPGRKELVREKQKVQPPSAESIAMGRARFCTLTNNHLKEPLAICRLGHIYNYEQILGALARKELPSKFAYISKLSDIKKVIIEKASPDSVNYIACPITKLQYNGFNKFVAFWSCGHVISRKALKEVKTQSQVCVVCQQPYLDKDLIDLNIEGQKLQIMRTALIERKKKRQRKLEPEEDQVKDTLKKKVKTDVHINAMDRLGGEFRDVIRQRNNFKGLFKKGEEPDWKANTYVIKPN